MVGHSRKNRTQHIHTCPETMEFTANQQAVASAAKLHCNVSSFFIYIQNVTEGNLQNSVRDKNGTQAQNYVKNRELKGGGGGGEGRRKKPGRNAAPKGICWGCVLKQAEWTELWGPPCHLPSPRVQTFFITTRRRSRGKSHSETKHLGSVKGETKCDQEK